MDEKDKKRVSKFISLVLRHRPELIGLKLNENGWVSVEALIEKSKIKNVHFSLEQLQEIVETNDKKRFSFNENGMLIRANQGHSIKTVDLQLEVVKPPEVLYHGTVEKNIASIKQTGLKKRSRQHLHLSADLETAKKVGSRRGRPVILKIQSQKMYKEGFSFFLSANGVWLTDHVPVEFINF